MLDQFATLVENLVQDCSAVSKRSIQSNANTSDSFEQKAKSFFLRSKSVGLEGIFPELSEKNT